MSAVTYLHSPHTPPISPNRFGEELDIRAFQTGLRTWCQEKEGTPEYASRLEAAELIEDCYRSQSTVLSLVGLYLTSIPKEIGVLQSLRSIDLEVNLLTSLPYEIYNLNRLIFLNLSENRLEFLPEGIHKLENLKELFLNNNPLTFLPMEIFWMQDCTIRVTGCPLPPEILECYSQESPKDHHSSFSPIR